MTKGSQRSMKIYFHGKAGTSLFEAFWTPALAGVTGFGGFWDTLSGTVSWTAIMAGSQNNEGIIR